MLAPTQQDLPQAGDFVAAKYRVEEVLGRGGMGAVFRVTHAVTGKSFAVKWLLPQYNAGQEVAQRFIREAQVAGRVEHPNIVEVYDIGEDRGSLYMVMELLQGESLAAHLARVGRVPASQACQLMISVTRGLAAAHRSGIIHRDLKPDNIFLSVSTLGEPRPKILDFGISKMSALASDANPALTREGVVMGTPHYMAPEQLRSHKVDERCDIYALGVILYQMLSGKLPFTGDNFPDLMIKIIAETPAPLAKLAPDVPRELVALVERAMSRNPADRFDSVAELGRALERFGEGALFDVEQARSVRPISSILPGPATPVATESSFPHTAGEPVDWRLRARRLAFPLAISAVSAVLLSWVYGSLGERTEPASAAAARVEPATRQPTAAASESHAAHYDDALPVPQITQLDESSPLPVAFDDAVVVAEAPALIGAAEPVKTPASPSPEPAQEIFKAAEAPRPSTTQALPAGVLPPAGPSTPQAIRTPGPVPPPGAATQVGESDAVKKQKKAAAAKKSAASSDDSPEMRIADFF